MQRDSSQPSPKNVVWDDAKATGMVKSVALIAENDNPQILDGIYAYAVKAGWWCGLERLFYGFSSLRLRENWDGVLSMSFSHLHAELLECRCPVVELYGIYENDRPPDVLVDWRSVGEMGARHLLERGFSTLVFYRRTLGNDSILTQQGFESVVRAEGIAPIILEYPKESGEQLQNLATRSNRVLWLKQRLPVHSMPFAIMVDDDRFAVEVIAVCRLLGWRIPEDVAVLGVCNNPQVARRLPIAMSSVETNEFEIGYRAAELLDRIMNGEPRPPQPLLIPPKRVIVRESTDIYIRSRASTRAAYEFIRHNFTHSITLEQIARHAGVSSRTLQSHFKQEIGRTIVDEINRVRLERAREMLGQTDLKISAIAHDAGFNSYGYFCKVFAGHFHQTPGEFRQQCAAGAGAPARKIAKK